MPSYKDVYLALKTTLRSLDVDVVDWPNPGWCLFREKMPRSVIYVNPLLPMDLRVYVLAHEAGHACIPVGKGLRIGNKIAGDRVADTRAIRILKDLGLYATSLSIKKVQKDIRKIYLHTPAYRRWKKEYEKETGHKYE